MDCERIQRLISLYLAGDIAGDDLETLMAHLSSCAKCRAAFEEAKRYEAALKGVFRESIAKSRSPKSRVLRKIEAEGLHGRRGKSLANWFIFFVLMAALCFLIVIAYVSYEKVKQENIRKAQSTRAELALMRQALDTYRADHDFYPLGGNADMVLALQSLSEGQGEPYYRFARGALSEGKAVDSWEEAYLYRSTGDTFLLYSAGPNRRDDDGLGDDIRP